MVTIFCDRPSNWMGAGIIKLPLLAALLCSALEVAACSRVIDVIQLCKTQFRRRWDNEMSVAVTDGVRGRWDFVSPCYLRGTLHSCGCWEMSSGLTGAPRASQLRLSRQETTFLYREWGVTLWHSIQASYPGKGTEYNSTSIEGLAGSQGLAALGTGDLNTPSVFQIRHLRNTSLLQMPR